MNLTLEAFMNNNIDHAINAEPLEEVIDDLVKEIKQRHIERLKKANVSHELKTPITAISGYAELHAAEISMNSAVGEGSEIKIRF